MKVLHLLRYAIGLKNSCNFFCPIRSKTKTNHESFAHVFSRFVSATRNYFEFWLVYCIDCLLCDWPEWLLWLWFYDTQLKTGLTSTTRWDLKDLIFVFHDPRDTLFGVTLFLFHNIHPVAVFIFIGIRFNSPSFTLAKIPKILALETSSHARKHLTRWNAPDKVSWPFFLRACIL